MHEGARIVEGSLSWLRLLDVSDTIELSRAAERLGADTRRVRLRRQVSQTLTTEALPLEIDLGKREAPLGLGCSELRVRVRVFAFGVVSVVMERALADVALAELAAPIAAGSELDALDALAREVTSDVMRRIGDAAVRPDVSPVIESYALILARRVQGDLLADRDALARALLAEPAEGALDPALRERALAHAHRWFEDDLVVLHYEAALVQEPTDSGDLATVLELAACQLLQLRACDARIDRELDRVQAALARAERRGWWIAEVSPFRGARESMARLVELAQLAEAADNATKFAADLYLAELYEDALDTFRIDDWRESVQRKLGLSTRVYELLKSEVDVRRTSVLEGIVILLILIEVVHAFWP